MNSSDLAAYIDLSLLKPTVSYADIRSIMKDSLKYPFASLCIPPYFVPYASVKLKGRRRICTVVGFPLGYTSKDAKLFEAAELAKYGADELDVVMNIAAFKSGEYNLVTEEVAAIVRTNKDATIKMIIEACYLTDEEKIKACEIAIESGAHYIKTSTGFGPGGASLDDVKLLCDTAGGRIKVKASGGISDMNAALAMINAGASRIGTSSGIRIIEELIGPQDQRSEQALESGK